MAAREVVSAHTLDELLALREALSGSIAQAVAERAAEVGLEVTSFGLKDLILPGEMKALLNRVIEAQKEAEANVILRREETAATRSLAQTARVLAENPLVVRLKELEAYKELAAKVGWQSWPPPEDWRFGSAFGPMVVEGSWRSWPWLRRPRPRSPSIRCRARRSAGLPRPSTWAMPTSAWARSPGPRRDTGNATSRASPSATRPEAGGPSGHAGPGDRSARSPRA